MKKSKLIKLLSEIDGDPDILLWNGHVGDWVGIDSKLVETDLVRETFEGYCTSLKYERMVKIQDGSYEIPEEEIQELKKYHTTIADWGFNDYVTEEEIKKRKYKKKSVFMLQSKQRELQSFNRAFTLEY
jgi:hypothetical protein